MEDIRKADARLENTVAKLAEGEKRLEDAIARAAETQTRLDYGIRRSERGFRDLGGFVETTDGTIEQELRSMFEYWVRKMGVEMMLSSLIVDDLEYGVAEGLTVVGEVTAHLRARHRSFADKKLERLRRLRPRTDRLQGREVSNKVWAHPEASEEAS